MSTMDSTGPVSGPVVRSPGLYPHLSIEAYHADPVPGGSLSSTGARRLLPPSCPALFRHEQLQPRHPSAAFEMGTAAHRLVLGVGPELFRVSFDDLRTKAAREEVAEARARGAVPLKPDAYEQVHEMAEALRQHPVAGRLLRPGTGAAEQPVFWRDPATGVMCRTMLDWLPADTGGRMVLPEYKTTRSASPADLPRAIDSYGYHQQGAWILEAVRALGLAGEDAAVLLVFQEKTAPYLVTVVELDVMALKIGRHRNRKAREVYRECVESGRWPGYSEGIELLGVPPYVENRYIEEVGFE